jgi:ATP-dependent helicase IRC3
MPLRDYQKEFISDVAKAREEGIRNMLAVSPTGTGKTTLLSNLPAALGLRPGERMLVLVHKIELCEQNAAALASWNPNLKVGIEREKERASEDCDLIVASIQTIGGAKAGRSDDPEDDYSDRLRRFDPARVKYIVVDEAHHVSVASSYARILRYFGVLKNHPKRDPDKLLFGMTATPSRSDNMGLEAFFDKIVFQRDILTMMRSGLTVDGVLRPWLCDLKPWRVQTEVDISKVAVNAGEFATKDLSAAIDTPERNRLIVDEYKKRGEDASFFAFTVDVKHSNDLAQAFRDEGIECYAISGDMPMRERRRLQDEFKAGKVRGLASCGVLSEGIDIPSVGCLLMCRPTKSGLLFKQQLGRGLRPFPAPEALYNSWRKGADPGPIKPYCVVLDFMDLAGRHNLNSVPTLLGIQSKFDMKGETALEAVREIEEIAAKSPSITPSLFDDLESMRAAATRIDLFAKPTVPDEVAQWSKLAWLTGIAEGVYQLILPDKGMLTISEDQLGQFEIHSSTNGVRTLIDTVKTLGEAFRRADREVPREAMIVLQSEAKWRTMEVTDKQIKMIRRLYPELRAAFPEGDAGRAAFSDMIRKTYSKGEASIIISKRYAGEKAGAAA